MPHRRQAERDLYKMTHLVTNCSEMQSSVTQDEGGRFGTTEKRNRGSRTVGRDSNFFIFDRSLHKRTKLVVI